MSDYTTQLRHICETYAGLTDQADAGSNTQTIIASALPSIFNFTFPLFDENYRTVLETKIIRHYYFREIAFETIGEWKFKLNTKLNEIMPYYNQLYESADLEYNPLTDVNYTTVHAGTGTEQGAVTGSVGYTGTQTVGSTFVHDSDSTNSQTVGSTNVDALTEHTNNDRLNWDKYSDTPQGGISGLDSDTYLTNARKVTDVNGQTHGSTDTTTFHSLTTGSATDDVTDTTNSHTVDANQTATTSKNSAMTTDEYITTVSGKYPGKSYQEMIKEYRDTLLNIDMLIINELETLFFALW